MLRVRLLEPVPPRRRSSFRARCGRRVTARVAVPLVRVPSAERETRRCCRRRRRRRRDFRTAGARTRACRPIRARRYRGGPRVAVDDRVSPAARWPGSDPRSLAVTVVRYTPQAVLIANVEEARYRTLASEDGRLLVEARYAVRNNQRSFLKVTLPAGATVWSADVGRAADSSRRRRSRRGAASARERAGRRGRADIRGELVYLQRIDAAWLDKGRTRLRAAGARSAGVADGLSSCTTRRASGSSRSLASFRLEYDPGPFAEALRDRPLRRRRGTRPGTAATRPTPATAGLQALVDRFQRRGRRPNGRRLAAGARDVSRHSVRRCSWRPS